MILFKRVSESLRHIEDREWALLALETLGVIAGILIAFWLNEWAGRHSAAQQRHERLERLFEESETTVTLLRNDRDQMNSIVDKEKAFATALVHRGECPPEPMWGAVDTLPQYPTISVPSSVYQEIMGAGGLSDIDDTTCAGRSAISIRSCPMCRARTTISGSMSATRSLLPTEALPMTSTFRGSSRKCRGTIGLHSAPVTNSGTGLPTARETTSPLHPCARIS